MNITNFILYQNILSTFAFFTKAGPSLHGPQHREAGADDGGHAELCECDGMRLVLRRPASDSGVCSGPA